MSISKSDLISNVAAATNLPRCHVEAVISATLDDALPIYRNPDWVRDFRAEAPAGT